MSVTSSADETWSKEDLLKEVQRLQTEVDAEKHKVESLNRENRKLRETAINIQQQTECEEEFIVNSLVKRVSALKQEKEQLLVEVEQEEEYLTNTLQRRLDTVRNEKIELERRLETEQDFIVNRLQKQLAVVIDEKVRLQKKLNKETSLERAERAAQSASESESEKEDTRDRLLSGDLMGVGDNIEKQNLIFEHLRRTIDSLRRDLKKSRHELDTQKEALQKSNDEKVIIAIKLRRFLHQKDGETVSSGGHHVDTSLDQEIEKILSSIGTRSRPSSFSRSAPIAIRSLSQSSENRSSPASSLDKSLTSPVGSLN